MAAVAGALVALALPQTAMGAPGDLDPTWDTDGKLSDNVVEVPRGVAIQSDGKVVTANHAGNLTVVRYNTDGSRDMSFSGDGLAEIDLGGDERARALAIQPGDQKIVVVGRSSTNSGDFLIGRFNTDGSPDTSFGGGDGIEATDIGTNTADIAQAVALQGDGKIVVAGTSASDWAVVRYTSTGALDTATFGGGDGMVTHDLGSASDNVAGVGIQSGGRIVVGGGTDSGGATGFDFAVGGFTSAGALDSSYGSGGIRTADFGTTGDTVLGFAMQSDGKAILIGYHDLTAFALARFDAGGTLDTSFDGDGKVTTAFDPFTEGRGVAVQQNGRIVAVGITGNGDCCDFAVARYEPNGTLDSSFGSGGKVTTSFDQFDSGSVVAINPSDGKIVVGGGSSSGACECDLARIARYLGDPPPEPEPEPEPEPQPQPNPCANDTSGPEISITSLQNKALYQQNESPASVRIQASDPSGLSSDPSTPGQAISTQTTGLKTVTATATDRCNNTATGVFRYRVAAPPAIQIAGVATSCRVSNFLVTIRIRGDVSVSRVTARLRGRLLGKGSSSRLTVKVPAKTLKAGRYTIVVATRDRAGNRSTMRVNFARCVVVEPTFTG